MSYIQYISHIYFLYEHIKITIDHLLRYITLEMHYHITFNMNYLIPINDLYSVD